MTGAPVLLMTRRRIIRVPKVELFAGSDGDMSLSRFGTAEDALAPSSRATPNPFGR